MYRAALFLSLAFLAADAIPVEALAQTSDRAIVVAQNERGGFFRFLTRPFRRNPNYVPAPPRQQQLPQYRIVVPQPERQAARPRRQRQKNAAPKAPVVPAVEKAEDAKRVLVVGDFMAGALAKGLTQAFEQNANVVIVDASNGSSGLIRQDYYNWPGELPALVEKEHPAAILALLGANDRQTIRLDSGPLALDTDEWAAAYTARAAGFADALKATGKPAIWIGLAPVAKSVTTRGYSAQNGIMREQAEGKGLRFTDVWIGFADEDGKFVSVGPDVSGQSVQLRNSDGLNFTKAGQRKLAYYVEQDLKDILGGATPLVATAPVLAPTTETGEPIPQIGPMVPMDALLAGGDTLSTSAVAGAAQSGTAAAAVLKRISGESKSMPPAGRADNFTWPPAAVPQ